ncbi:winged helix-turn-helix domain-containing protein [Moritella marina]|uniref:winged helix-turn-helix domain-containing protein n=1 Tax=Moritella marina TaxID=90736 RepID=UPI0012FD9324
MYFEINHKSDISEYNKLGKRELLLLTFLLQSPREVIGKELIVKTVWPNRIVTDSSLNVTVHNLRKFIKSVSSNIIIKNFSGVGYALYKNAAS